MDFETELKRAFAETPDPADDGFAARVSARVAGTERRRAADLLARRAGIGLAAIAAGMGLWELAGGVGLDLAANLGLGLARIHGALSQGGETALAAADAGSGAFLGLGLTQLMVLTVSVAGGLVALRQARD